MPGDGDALLWGMSSILEKALVGALTFLATSTLIVLGSAFTDGRIVALMGGVQRSEFEQYRGVVASGIVGLFFARDECPAQSGWSPVPDTFLGRYIVAVDGSASVGGVKGAPLSDLEDRPAGAHNHEYDLPEHTTSGAGGSRLRDEGAGHVLSGSRTGRGVSDNEPLKPGTNAPYIQLLACWRAVAE
jgi:hypothetical protein